MITTDEQAAHRDGYETAAREIETGSASRMSAKERGLFPDDQESRIEWDRGYDAACAAFRLGNDPAELLRTIGPVELPLTICGILDEIGAGLVLRPDPRRR